MTRAKRVPGRAVELSAAQRKVALAIHSLVEANGYSPTFREVQAATGYASKAPVHRVVLQLRSLGIVPETSRPGSLRLADNIVVRDDTIFMIGEPYDGR